MIIKGGYVDPDIFGNHSRGRIVVAVFAENLARGSKNFSFHGGGILPGLFKAGWHLALSFHSSIIFQHMFPSNDGKI
jgi:hypothetical protein